MAPTDPYFKRGLHGDGAVMSLKLGGRQIAGEHGHQHHHQQQQQQQQTDHVVYVVAKYDYTAQGSQELDIKKNERLLLIDDSKHWWKVQNGRKVSGYVPSNYVKREKPSIFDSIKRKVKKKPEFKTMPLPNTGCTALMTTDVNVNPTLVHPILPMLPPAPSSMGNDGDLSSHVSSAAIVRYPYESQQDDEISLIKGTRVLVMEKSNDGWWRGEYGGRVGWFPSNYVYEDEGGGGLGDGHHTYAHASDGTATSLSTTTATDINCRHQQETNFGVGCLDVVLALYAFASQNDEELNFSKGERLEIVEKPENDPEWWRARNGHGELGLVPKNYVRVVAPGSTTEDDGGGGGVAVDSDGVVVGDIANLSLANPCGDASGGAAVLDLHDKSWYRGNITRNHCDRLLNEFGSDGDYLVRDSETNVGDYSVSLKAPGRNKHFRVHVEDGVFCIGQRRFNSLDDLIEHYERAPIYTSPRGDKMFLVKPFRMSSS